MPLLVAEPVPASVVLRPGVEKEALLAAVERKLLPASVLSGKGQRELLLFSSRLQCFGNMPGQNDL